MTSSPISLGNSADLIFFFKISLLNSKSGGNILTVNPQQNLVFNLSSRFLKSFGDLSLDIIICLLSLCSVLKVLKKHLGQHQYSVRGGKYEKDL